MNNNSSNNQPLFGSVVNSPQKAKKDQTTSPRIQRRAPAQKPQPVVTTEEDIGKCRVTPIDDRKVLAFLRQARRLPDFRFVPLDDQDTLQRTAQWRQLEQFVADWTPVDFYKTCFELEPDPRVVGRVRKMLAREREGIKNGTKQFHESEFTGYIYCFHYLADPEDVVKIGRTQRDPDVRVREWEQELGAKPGDVVKLFAYRTVANKFAEAITHAVLMCEHQVARINPRTDEMLDEFFRVNNIMALKKFVAKTVTFINSFSLYYRDRRQQ
jgi:hypothetical protein